MPTSPWPLALCVLVAQAAAPPVAPPQDAPGAGPPALSAPAPARAPAIDRIETLLGQGELKGARVAVSVVDVDQGQALFARNVDLPLAPASNMKLLTTAAAISLLGPQHVFRTR